MVNLTAFETFYEEKRPFFVEGRNIFHYQLMGGDGDFSQDNLFYSRRIGRNPHYSPAVDGYVDMPAATLILGAFKMTGKTRSGLSIGILESVTSRETASVFSGGLTREEPVERSAERAARSNSASRAAAAGRTWPAFPGGLPVSSSTTSATCGRGIRPSNISGRVTGSPSPSGPSARSIST